MTVPTITYDQIVKTAMPIISSVLNKQGWRLSVATMQLLLDTHLSPTHAVGNEIVRAKLQQDIQEDPIFNSILTDIGNMTATSLAQLSLRDCGETVNILQMYTGVVYETITYYELGAIVLSLVPMFMSEKYLRNIAVRGGTNGSQ